jgi:hypothetical protein
MLRSLMISTPHPILLSDIIEKNEMGRVCSANGEGRSVYSLLVGRPERNRPLESTGVDGSIILKWIIRNWDVGVWT